MPEVKRLHSLICSNNERYFKGIEPHYLIQGQTGLGSYHHVRWPTIPVS
jgi:hypothetical protein